MASTKKTLKGFSLFLLRTAGEYTHIGSMLRSVSRGLALDPADRADFEQSLEVLANAAASLAAAAEKPQADVINDEVAQRITDAVNAANVADQAKIAELETALAKLGEEVLSIPRIDVSTLAQTIREQVVAEIAAKASENTSGSEG